jgi:hypothetical protein
MIAIPKLNLCQKAWRILCASASLRAPLSFVLEKFVSLSDLLQLISNSKSFVKVRKEMDKLFDMKFLVYRLQMSLKSVLLATPSHPIRILTNATAMNLHQSCWFPTQSSKETIIS